MMCVVPSICCAFFSYGNSPPIDLIICDEGRSVVDILASILTTILAGHRLKSAKNKTSEMFKALRTKRRIILSGTPIQNDLGEFHAMVFIYIYIVLVE